ncbi:hypothetical protein MRB53_040284 [Persea americana]|nr:hypothetical protein MRB53_040284 [Persea americana]
MEDPSSSRGIHTVTCADAMLGCNAQSFKHLGAFRLGQVSQSRNGNGDASIMKAGARNGCPLARVPRQNSG